MNGNSNGIQPVVELATNNGSYPYPVYPMMNGGGFGNSGFLGGDGWIILLLILAFSVGKKVGDETSMGWKILDIHYKYKDNYYCFNDFMKIFEKEVKEKHNRKLIKFMIKKLNSMI